MKTFLLVLAGVLTLITSCKNIEQPTTDVWKEEILAVEAAFDSVAQKNGLPIAFKTYAAPDGVIRRGKNIIQGKEAIFSWYTEDSLPNETLSWKPDFVDVSSSGDMGYTYGSYVFTSTDSAGTKKERTGKFHTVWKRQPDGSWKFVYD